MKRLIEVLRHGPVEVHLVTSASARRVVELDTDYTLAEIEALADHVHDNDDIAAPISSGSFRTGGMIIAPCSIKSLSAIANSYNDTLLARAADVVLMPSFCHQPKTIDDIVNHTVGKVLDQFDVDHDLFHRWEGGRARMLERGAE